MLAGSFEYYFRSSLAAAGSTSQVALLLTVPKQCDALWAHVGAVAATNAGVLVNKHLQAYSKVHDTPQLELLLSLLLLLLLLLLAIAAILQCSLGQAAGL